MWCPRARDVSGWPADAAAESARDESLAHFSWHWRRGHPVVVRGVHLDESDWTPESLERAMDGTEVAGGSERERHVGSERERHVTDGPARSALRMVRVVACGDDDDEGVAGEDAPLGAAAMTPRDFFRGYRDASAFTNAIGDASLFRLRAWGGTGAGFRDARPDAYARFVASLPFPEVTHPSEGPLNLSAHVPKRVGPADPGPRVVASHGARDERGVGDSVLALRAAVVDRAVVVAHSRDAAKDEEARGGQRRGGETIRGAEIPSDEPDGVPSDEPDGVPSDAVVLWHVFPREDAAGLRERLGDAPGPSRYLASGELARLAEPTEPGAAAFAPWRVPLRRGEMVLVPAGCPAQCRHLESCVTVSLDFTAPESADASLETFSAARDAGGGGAVAARTTLLHAARAAVDALDERERERKKEEDA